MREIVFFPSQCIALHCIACQIERCLLHLHNLNAWWIGDWKSMIYYQNVVDCNALAMNENSSTPSEKVTRDYWNLNLYIDSMELEVFLFIYSTLEFNFRAKGVFLLHLFAISTRGKAHIFQLNSIRCSSFVDFIYSIGYRNVSNTQYLLLTRIAFATFTEANAFLWWKNILEYCVQCDRNGRNIGFFPSELVEIFRWNMFKSSILIPWANNSSWNNERL